MLIKKHPQAFIHPPGTVGMIPGTIWLLFLVIALVLVGKKKEKPIHPLMLMFIFGSLIPLFDDLITFIFGPPFSHHSVFHSVFGPIITYLVVFLIFNRDLAKFAFWGHLIHLIFNFGLDYVSLFFPFTRNEIGLTMFIGVSTYEIKAFFYPLILIFFFGALVFYLKEEVRFFKK